MMKENREVFKKAALQAIYDLDEIAIEPHVTLSGVHTEVNELIELNNAETLKSRHSY
jgi:hypothetical protein